MPATVKIYRYLETKWAIKTLRERRLKVSHIKGLNDPFEWRIGTIADDMTHATAGREAFDEFVDRLNKQFGMISYSAELATAQHPIRSTGRSPRALSTAFTGKAVS